MARSEGKYDSGAGQSIAVDRYRGNSHLPVTASPSDRDCRPEFVTAVTDSIGKNNEVYNYYEKNIRENYIQT